MTGQLEKTLLQEKGMNVVVDACNCNSGVRRNIIRIARKMGMWRVSAIFVDTPKEVCLSRVTGQGESRKKQLAALDKHHDDLAYGPPSTREGWNQVITVTNNEGIANAVQLVTSEEEEDTSNSPAAGDKADSAGRN